jgi:hypothetical protein
MFLKDHNVIDQKPFHSKFSWQLSQALVLADLHELVEHFFKIYVKDAYRQLFRMQPGRVPVRLLECLSKMEKIRFRRSFYGYEMCCQLFRTRCQAPEDHSSWNPFDHGGGFFKSFAPWEVEQLVCVYDYMMRIMTRGLHTLNPLIFSLFLNLKIS